MSKKEIWELMKRIGADKIYLELKAAGLNPGIPEVTLLKEPMSKLVNKVKS